MLLFFREVVVYNLCRGLNVEGGVVFVGKLSWGVILEFGWSRIRRVSGIRRFGRLSVCVLCMLIILSTFCGIISYRLLSRLSRVGIF